MVPFRALPALCHIITGISLSCPWCSTCFTSAFGNGTIFLDIKLFMKCGRRAVESYVVLVGSLPNARLVANVMAKSLPHCPLVVQKVHWSYLPHKSSV